MRVIFIIAFICILIILPTCNISDITESQPARVSALGLRSVTIGAFDDARVKSLLALPENESPLYIITIGNSP